jgi:hypothetical protein
MKWSKVKTTIVLSLLGLLLGGSKIVWLFFNFLNILDLVIFLGIGYALGGKVAGGRWLWGLLLALPAFALDSFFVARLGYSKIITGIGTGYAVSLVLIPLAACVGIALGAKHALRNSA